MGKKIIAFFALITVIAGLNTYSFIAGQDKGAGKVGVINLKEFPEKYEKFKAKVAKLKESVEKVKEDLRKLEEEMKGLQERRELFEPDTEKYEEYTEKIDEIRINAATRLQSTKRQLERKEKQYLETLYKEIREGVKEYARSHNFDIIMIETGSDLMGKTAEELTQMMYMKTVIYAGPDLDITDKVIDFMNAKFNEEVGKSPAPADEE